MSKPEIDLHAALKKYFGFSQFKGLQEEVITSIVNKEHTFVIMPTGGGKSLTYQLPALIEEGTAIVVSPLIALMKNQVDSLRGISKEYGIAHVLNSSLNKAEVKQVKDDIQNGTTKLLYVAPESLTKEEYVDFLREQTVSFVAIDEAHCISEWGHDFRPEYRNLRHIIQRIGDNIPIIAVTATATIAVTTVLILQKVAFMFTCACIWTIVCMRIFVSTGATTLGIAEFIWQLELLYFKCINILIMARVNTNMPQNLIVWFWVPAPYINKDILGVQFSTCGIHERIPEPNKRHLRTAKYKIGVTYQKL